MLQFRFIQCSVLSLCITDCNLRPGRLLDWRRPCLFCSYFCKPTRRGSLIRLVQASPLDKTISNSQWDKTISYSVYTKSATLPVQDEL